MIQVDYSGATPNIDITGGAPVHVDVAQRGPAGARGPEGPGAGELTAQLASQRGWRALREALRAGVARVVAMGDSKTEGAGVSTVDQRWLDLLAGTLRARYAPNGDHGQGYLPAYYKTFYGFPSAPVASGTAVEVGDAGGLGNRSMRLETGASLTWTVPAWTAGVPLIVHFTRASGAGDLEVVTGGAVRATIPTAGAAVSTTSTVTIPAGATGVTVRHKVGTGNGTARVEGIVHRTSTTGVVVYDGAASGGKVTDFTVGAGADRHWGAVAEVAPHAVILAFGANDQSDPPGGRTVSQWRTDLVAAVERARVSAPGAGIVLLHGAQRVEDVVEDPLRIVRFEQAARAAIGDEPDVHIVYESSLWAPTAGVDYTAGDPSGWLADTVHTSASANAQIARYLAALITGADVATDVAAMVQPAVDAAVTAEVNSRPHVVQDPSTQRLYFTGV